MRSTLLLLPVKHRVVPQKTARIALETSNWQGLSSREGLMLGLLIGSCFGLLVAVEILRSRHATGMEGCADLNRSDQSPKGTLTFYMKVGLQTS